MMSVMVMRKNARRAEPASLALAGPNRSDGGSERTRAPTIVALVIVLCIVKLSLLAALSKQAGFDILGFTIVFGC